jgi:hypothetical protein
MIRNCIACDETKECRASLCSDVWLESDYHRKCLPNHMGINLYSLHSKI